MFEIWRAQGHSFLDMLERSCVGEGEVTAVHQKKKALAKRLDSLASRFKTLEDKELESGEAKEAKGVKVPKAPTQTEREQHSLTHLPFEAWCDDCVQGRGKEKPHRHVEPGESVIPEIQTDYTFLRSQFDGETDESRDDKITVLTMIKSDTGYGHCTVCESKGTSDRFVTKVFVKFLEELGLANQNVIIKSDQEESIRDLVRSVSALRRLRLCRKKLRSIALRELELARDSISPCRRWFARLN